MLVGKRSALSKRSGLGVHDIPEAQVEGHRARLPDRTERTQSSVVVGAVLGPRAPVANTAASLAAIRADAIRG